MRAKNMTEKHDKIIIERPFKDHRDKVLPLRVTEQEQESTMQLKGQLDFDSFHHFFLFCKHIVEQLYSWHTQGYAFFIKKKGEKRYQEVGFRFQPEPKTEADES